MGKDVRQELNRAQTIEALTFEQQADATLTQANPVANTLYTVLDTTNNVEIESVTAHVTWTVQPTPLEVVITKDGVTEIFAFTNPASGTDYTLIQSAQSLPAAAASQILAVTLSATVLLHRPIQGRSIKVEVRTGKTTAGTTSFLVARVKYALRS